MKKNRIKRDSKTLIFTALLDSNVYEREFTANGKRFKLVGFNRKSPKNCCSIYCISDGKTYKCGAEMVKRAFNDK